MNGGAAAKLLRQWWESTCIQNYPLQCADRLYDMGNKYRGEGNANVIQWQLGINERSARSHFPHYQCDDIPSLRKAECKNYL